MLTKKEIKNLLDDIENERVERTISTTNTDKFAQAVALLPMTYGTATCLDICLSVSMTTAH